MSSLLLTDGEMGKLSYLKMSPILDSLVVRISACHVEGPGSIPGRGVKSFENPPGAGESPKHPSLYFHYSLKQVVPCLIK